MKLTIRPAVIVEGRYDAARLTNLVDSISGQRKDN